VLKIGAVKAKFMKNFILNFLFFICSLSLFGQDSIFVNSSFEQFSGCISTLSPPHSQFGNVVFGWENALPTNVSTADFFTTRDSSCQFTGFSSLTNTVSLASGNASQGCSWAGVYLNYDDTSSINSKYREYIAQDISLIAGVTYTLSVDLARSNSSTSNNLEVDFGIYGYFGGIPAGQVDYCLINGDGTNAPLFASINKASITTAFQTFTVTFTPSQNYDYIVLGGADCSIDATGIGYVFIDNVQLSASNNSVVNPVIESCSSQGLCELHCFKQSFYLTGNTAPPGTIATWTQSLSNPEQVTFTTPNASTTNILGSGSFIEGLYQFYYTFTNGNTTVSDTANIYISDFPTLQNFAIGPDIDLCNGSIDSLGLYRGVYMNMTTPSNQMISDGNTQVWWSMIRNDGTEWIFPNGCIAANGFDEGDVYVVPIGVLNCNINAPSTTNSSNPTFRFRNPRDTVVFIWHISETDDCNTTETLVDTMEVIINDIDFQGSTELVPFTSICIGETAIVHQLANNTNYEILNNEPGLQFTWSYFPMNGGLSYLDNTVSDSAQITGLIAGNYVVKVDVYDSISGCSWYDYVNLNISPCTVSAGVDITVGCDPSRLNNDINHNNYSYVESSIKRRVFMDASPDDATIQNSNMSSWWSMIRADGSEWTFPNGCVPANGTDEGDVSSNSTISSCGYPINASPASSKALFNIKNPMDTVSFIWHVTKFNAITGVTDTLIDTMVVNMKDIDLPFSSYVNAEIPWVTFCEDSLLIHQYIATRFRPLAADTNLSFAWSVVKPFGINLVWDPTSLATIVDSTLNDSIILVTPFSTKKYRVRVEVSEISTGCSWMDYVTVKRITPLTLDAGPDSFECVSVTGDYVFNTNATIAYQGTDSDPVTLASTWWSTVQDDGSEWIFPNDCVPDDGADQGDVYALYQPYGGACNSEVPDSLYSNSRISKFGFRFPGSRLLIWNAIDPCTGNVIKDTISIGYGFLDQANAGLDLSVTCNVVSLEGNLSSLSSANSGYYQWEQLSGPDTVSLLNSSDNIAYFSTSNLTNGIYEFVYTLGLFPCQTTDTVAITVTGTTNQFVGMTSNYNPSSILCLSDTVTFSASGGQQYAFLLNGTIVQPFSPINTFTFSGFSGVNYVSVLALIGQSNCIETLDSAHVINANILPTIDISNMPQEVCEGEDLFYQLPYASNGTYYWDGPNGFNISDSTFSIQNIDLTSQGGYSVYYVSGSCTSDTSNFNITVNSNYNITQSFFICPNDSILINGVYILNSGVYYDSLQTNSGCDSIVTTNINVGDTIFNSIEICNGDSILIDGIFQNSLGIYTSTHLSVQNCDSITQTTLIVNDTYLFQDTLDICHLDSASLNNQYYFSSGLYTDSLTTINGCDSVYTLLLTVLQPNESYAYPTICEGDSLLVFQNYETLSGTYNAVYTAINGCDSTHYIILNVDSTTEINITTNTCIGDSVFLENEYQFQTGVYHDTLFNQNGCDSILITHLNVNNVSASFDTLSACGSYYWTSNNENYTVSGDYVNHAINQFGCDSVVNLNLNIFAIQQTEITYPFFCDSTYFNDRWIYYSEVIVDTIVSTTGCDSLIFNYLDIRNCSVTSNFSDLYIPNVLTPGGDGINDRFIITSFGEIIRENAELFIYNRWGTLLFYSNTDMIWDGGDHSEGTYYYIFKYKGKDYHGHLRLIRE